MANKSNAKLEKQVIRELFNNIQNLIESSRTRVALTVNREITLLYCHIGKEINGRILKNERAEYGERIVSSLSEQLTSSFGKGWGKRHLWHCVRSADIFSEDEIVNALSTQLSWTHLVNVQQLRMN